VSGSGIDVDGVAAAAAGQSRSSSGAQVICSPTAGQAALPRSASMVPVHGVSAAGGQATLIHSASMAPVRGVSAAGGPLLNRGPAVSLLAKPKPQHYRPAAMAKSDRQSDREERGV
jgi:hypothetical protein